MKNKELPIHIQIQDLINQTADLNKTDVLHKQMCNIRKFIYANTNLNNELNIRINKFKKISSKKGFASQLESFSEILKKNKKSSITGNVEDVFYFPTMGSMAIYFVTYEKILPKTYSGIYELYNTLQGVNRIGFFPKEVFEDTKDYIDFYILKALENYIVSPKNIGKSSWNEYHNKNTLYRIDDDEDEFLICWLRAVLLGVLSKLYTYSKKLPNVKFPVKLIRYTDTNCYKLHNEDFDLSETEKLILQEVTSPKQKQNKNAIRKHISNINKKARQIIGANIITCKNKAKLYRINEKFAIYQD